MIWLWTELEIKLEKPRWVDFGNILVVRVLSELIYHEIEK